MTTKSSQQPVQFRVGITTRLWLAFVLILVMFASMGIIGTRSLDALSELTHKMYRHPFSVSNAVRDIQYRITAMDRDMKLVAVADTSEKIQQLLMQIDEHERQVLLAFGLIHQRFLGNLAQLKKARESFVNWRPVRQRVIKSMIKQNPQKAREITLKKGATHVKIMELSIGRLLEYANNKAETFLQHTIQQRDSTIQVFWILIVSLSLLVVLTGVFITRLIIRPIVRMSKSLERLALGDVQGEITDRNRGDEIGSIANAVYELQQSNKILSESAIKIAKGDLSIDIEIRSENDALASSMAKMLAKQRKSNYIRGGINQLNEVMRGNQNIMELSDNIIRFLCQYTESELGCFYLNQSGWIHTVASYAIVLDLLPRDVFKMGEGLVGETALQKKILFIKDLPPKYMTISSASGQAVLHTVTIIPVILNDEVVALIELGRTDELSQDHLDFIEAVNIPIAVTLNAAISHAEEQFMVYTNEAEDE